MTQEYSDIPPKKFYKYHSLSGSSALHLINTLLKKEVHFSSPRSFNDPFDCKPRYARTMNRENFIENFIRVRKSNTLYLSDQLLQQHAEQIWNKKLSLPGAIESLILDIQREMGLKMENSAIYCVSEVWDDILMWGHYADSHRGICLEFNSSSDFLLEAQRVVYEKTRPEIKIFDHQNTVENMTKTLLTKSAHWSYEKEWRVVKLRKAAGLQRFQDGDLTGIILGSAISDSMENTIRNISKNHPTEIKVYRSIPDEREFGLRIEPA